MYTIFIFKCELPRQGNNIDMIFSTNFDMNQICFSPPILMKNTETQNLPMTTFITPPLGPAAVFIVMQSTIRVKLLSEKYNDNKLNIFRRFCIFSKNNLNILKLILKSTHYIVVLYKFSTTTLF